MVDIRALWRPGYFPRIFLDDETDDIGNALVDEGKPPH